MVENLSENNAKASQLTTDCQHPTYRNTAPNLEPILGKAFPVLDHGFVRVVDYMGDDGSIVQAARVSYGTGTRKVREDRGLIRYLLRHRHTTPFEMCEIKFHIKLPIFVARQWIRHRTANVNEHSARYSVLDQEFYVPDRAQMAIQSAQNRQGRGALISDDVAEVYRETLRNNAETAFTSYQQMIAGAEEDTEPNGLTRELARIGLPVSTYTQWYWKIDLHNLFHFLKLRLDPHAQYEIRVYAETMATIVEQWVPMAYEAFRDYSLHAATLSRMEVVALQSLLEGSPPAWESWGLSPREVREFCERFQLDPTTGRRIGEVK